MSLAIVAGLVSLMLAVLLEEAGAWFSQNALDRMVGDGEEEDAATFARSARQARLLARLLAAAAFVIPLAASHKFGPPYAPPIVAILALLWAVIGSTLVAVRWQSPLSLAGRAVLRPLAEVGNVLRWILVALHRMPGIGRPASSAERLLELDHELRWLQGRSGEDEEGKMLATLQEFGEACVEDVMVPREEVVGIPAEATVPEILDVVRREGYTRYPVYRDSLDTVVGVLHVFDLLAASPEVTAAALVREPVLTSGTKPVGTLLRELQATYNQLAVAVDEYGGMAGIATVEDLLEELVGEIHDELDIEEESPLRRIEAGVYWVEGTMRLEDLNEALGLDLEEGEYDTVAGLVLDRLERIPLPGERVREDGVALEVAAAEPQRIIALRLTLIEETGENMKGARNVAPGARR
jgi:CBS domain containing-hemolysin-like protein